jgi:hypothetical protein
MLPWQLGYINRILILTNYHKYPPYSEQLNQLAFFIHFFHHPIFSFSGMIFNEQDQEVRDMGYHKHAFNVLISNRLGYHRDLPDTRDDK